MLDCDSRSSSCGGEALLDDCDSRPLSGKCHLCSWSCAGDAILACDFRSSSCGVEVRYLLTMTCAFRQLEEKRCSTVICAPRQLVGGSARL